jgi:hypothetical protein
MTGTPTIGRIVLYRLASHDADRIEQRRLETRAHQSPGFNAAYAGDVYPAIVVRTNKGLSVNLQVFLDGADTLWVTSRGYSAETEGCWYWPARQDMTKEGR